MWLAWAIPLLAVVFLWSVNEFFRGRLKNQISGTLALLIFALCAVAFVVSGWMMGLAALVGSFILAALARAPALWVAKKFVEYPDLGADEYSRKRLENTLGGFGSPDYFKRLDREHEADKHHMAKTIAKALGRQDVQAVMNRHGLVLKDIELFYQRFEIHSLPPNLGEMAVCNANMLDYFFVNSTAAEVAGEYVRNIEDQNVVINLTLWAKHNPADSVR